MYDNYYNYRNEKNYSYKFRWDSLEERRTVHGPDRNGLSEAAFEISLNLTPRYMYDEETYDEPMDVYSAVMKEVITSWKTNNENEITWILPN